MLKTRKNVLPHSKGHSTYCTNLTWVEKREFRSLLSAALYHSPVAAQRNRKPWPMLTPFRSPADTPLLSRKVLFLHSSH